MPGQFEDPAMRLIRDLCQQTNDELIRHYTFSEFDLASIRQRRGNHNRLGFAVQLCYLRYPGFALPTQGENVVFDFVEVLPGPRSAV